MHAPFNTNITIAYEALVVIVVIVGVGQGPCTGHLLTVVMVMTAAVAVVAVVAVVSMRIFDRLWVKKAECGVAHFRPCRYLGYL
jgi:hypothetical protein